MCRVRLNKDTGRWKVEIDQLGHSHGATAEEALAGHHQFREPTKDERTIIEACWGTRDLPKDIVSKYQIINKDISNMYSLLR